MNKVGIFEDENARIVAKRLIAAGFEVVFVANNMAAAREAIALGLMCVFMVFLDGDLSEFSTHAEDGLALLKIIREQYPFVFIVWMASTDFPADAAQRPDAILTKEELVDLEPNQLQAHLQKLLRLSYSQSDREPC